MATIKKSKAKNLSAGPSKKTPIAPKVDPKGQYTKIQERTLGNMKKGGKVKKAQLGKTQGRNPKNADYELNAPLQKGTNRDRNLTNTTRQDIQKMRVMNKDRNSFVGPLTKFGNETGQDDKYVKYRGPNYDESPRGRLDRQQKNGGKTSKAKDGKWIQKAVKTMRTDKPCTGPKFGSKTCPPGSKRYNLAKTFKKMSKKK